jgi:hypothetical protein
MVLGHTLAAGRCGAPGPPSAPVTCILKITELTPTGGGYVGKTILQDGEIKQYDGGAWWHQAVAEVPANIPDLYAYIKDARTRNIILIRGAPANIARKRTRRQIAFIAERGSNRGDHGFVDQPTRLITLDVDDFPGSWQADPEAAVRDIVEQLGAPWNSAGFVWFFSATHGLEKKHKKWTGRLTDDSIRVRLTFIAERPVTSGEAAAWMDQQPKKFRLDAVLTRTVQPNFIARPRLKARPGEEVLGDIPTIGFVDGDRLAVPSDLAEQAKVYHASGKGSDVAHHPDAETAVLAIGSDGRIRQHIKSAVIHTHHAAPKASAEDLAHTVATMAEEARVTITKNLVPFGRPWDDVAGYLGKNCIDWAQWIIDHDASANIGGDTEPTYPEPAFGDIGQARLAIKNQCRDFLWGVRYPKDLSNVFLDYGQSIPDRVPRVVAGNFTTGVGKTREIAASISEWKPRVDVEPAGVAVPRHQLSRALLQLFTERGVFARIFRGRTALDPRHHKDGAVKKGEPKVLMCLNMPAVELATQMHADVEKTCCKNKHVECAFYQQCGYQLQKRGVKPSVWIFAHDILFHTQPAIQLSVLFIDESFWQKSLAGIEEPQSIALDELHAPAVELPERERELRAARNLLADVLSRQNDDGGVNVGPLRDAFGYPSRIRHILNELEWKSLPEAPIYPGMAPAELARVAKYNAPLLATIRRSRSIITIWETIEELLDSDIVETSGRLTLKRNNNGLRIIEWKGVRPIRKQFRVPSMLSDATLPAENLLRISHPQVEILERFTVAMPREHVHVRQLLKAPTSSNKLITGKSDIHRQDVRRYILQRWLELGRAKTLVICQEKYEQWLRDAGLPGNIHVEHFNNVTGLDIYKDVRLHLVIGRTAPGPRAVERIAAALTGIQPQTMPEGEFVWYESVIQGIRLHDGTGVETRGDRHLDPMAESVRKQIVEAELIQAIGRSRAVNRTAATPLDIDLLFASALEDILAESAPDWATPSRLIDTAVSDGIMLTSPTDMTRAFPDIWPTRGAAEWTLKEGIPELPGFQIVTYQPPGGRQKKRQAYANLAHEAWGAWLAGQGWKLGEAKRAHRRRG